MATGTYEARRGWAACFAVEKTENWQADFRGVVTLEDGAKYWVDVYNRVARNGEREIPGGQIRGSTVWAWVNCLHA